MKKHLISKVLAGFSAFGVALTLVACGSKKNPTTTTTTPTPTSTPTTPSTTSTSVEEKVSVTFNANNGSNNVIVEVVKGHQIEKPDNPSKAESEGISFEFDKWYTDEALTEAYNFSSAVNSNITLYAGYIEKVSVTFEFNNGTKKSVTSVVKGQTIAKPEDDPVKAATDDESFDFDKWYSDSELQNEYDFTQAVNSPLKLYAGYTEKVAVTFNANNGTDNVIVEVVKGGYVTLPANPQKTDYTFVGWFKEETLVNQFNATTDTVDAKMTLYAKWLSNEEVEEANKATVTFVKNNGETNLEVKVVKGGYASATIPEKASANGIVYVFDTWCTDEALTTPFDFTTAISDNITLYARYTEKVSVTFNANNGSNNTTVLVIKGEKVEKPTDPYKKSSGTTGYTFDKWYSDEALGTPFDFNSALNAPVTLYAKYTSKEYDKFDTYVDFEDATVILDGNNVPQGIPVSVSVDMYTVEKDTKFVNRQKSWTNPDNSSIILDFTKAVRLDDDNSGALTVDVYAGLEQVVYLWVENGSSTGESTLAITKPDGSKYELSYQVPTGSSIALVEIPVSEGKWMVQRRTGTNYIYAVDLAGLFEKSEVAGFDITNEGTTHYLAGEMYSSDGIVVSVTYKNGKKENLAKTDYTIEYPTDTFATSPLHYGTHQISIKYSNFGKKTINVVVDQVDSQLKLGFNKVVQEGHTSYGNGTYINKSVKIVYGLGDTLSLDNLSISVTGGTNVVNIATNDQALTVSGFDSTSVGKKTISLHYDNGIYNATATYDVYVVDNSKLSVATELGVDYIYIKVDQAYEGEIGAVVTDVYEFNMFTSLTQAFQYIENNKAIIDNRNIRMAVMGGTYHEKLEITQPNMAIMGLGANDVIIEYDSLYGQQDESGFTHVTDSTQTVAIRESATNVQISGVTISNCYNNISSFDGTAKAGQGERGLALLVQADQFCLADAKLLGWQDTVELFKGRQYFERVYISGCIDYVFGTNNTTFFRECELHTVKGKAGASADNVNAYVTAFKGCNSDTDDTGRVLYGAIFDACTFTSDDDFVGTYALSRPWSVYSNVVIINSTFDDKVNLKESETIRSGLVKVNGQAISLDLDTITFKFYNNRDKNDQLLELVDDFTNVDTTLTSTEAANYSYTPYLSSYPKFFGMNNGKVTYALSWDPRYGLEVDNNIYYVFGGVTPPTGTSYVWQDTNAGVVDTTFNGLTINTSKCKYISDQDGFTEVQPGTMSFTAPKDSLITIVTGFNTYNAYYVTDAIGKFYANSASISFYSLADQTITITFTSKVYLLRIIISPNADEPENLVVSSISVSNAKEEFIIGEDFEYSTIKIKEYWSDNLITETTYYDGIETDYDFITPNGFDKDTVGTYEITVRNRLYDVSTSYDIKYIAAPSNAISTDTTFALANTNDALVAQCTNGEIKTEKTVGKFTIDGTDGKLGINGDNCQLNAGAKIIFTVAANSLVTVNAHSYNESCKKYTINGIATDTLNFSQFYSEETEITIVATAQTYLYGIVIDCDATAPAAKTLTSLEVSGYSTDDINVGTDYTYPTTLIVKALYSDHSIRTLGLKTLENVDGYEISNNINSAAAGNYTVTITYGGENTSYPVKYVASVSDVFEDSTVIDFSSTTALNLSLQNSKITYADNFISGTDYSDHTDSIQLKSANAYFSFKVKAGATVTVTSFGGGYGYLLINGVSNNSVNDYTLEATADMTITISAENSEATGNAWNKSYLKKITITYPFVITSNTNINFGTDGNFNTLVSNGTISSSVTINDTGRTNNAMVYGGNIEFYVASGATVTIYGNSQVNYVANGVPVQGSGLNYNDGQHVVTPDAKGKVTIECDTSSQGNNYFYYIVITF